MSGLSDALDTLLTSLASSTSGTQAANLIGNHMTQQNNMQTSVKALLSLATPANASSIATQIAAIPGVPSTVSVLLQELSAATSQAQVTTIALQIEAALSANTNSLGNILSVL